MTSQGAPRVVVVTRPTDYAALVAQHGTHAMAKFFLESRGQDIGEVRARHARFEQVLHAVSRAIPSRWRSVRVPRAELSRFVFEPDDVVVAVGPDGLVPNVAKYLAGQRVIGVNADPERCDGVLVRHAPDRVEGVLHATIAGRVRIESRTMAEARLDDGQRLVALNEIFVGHRTHQSARYRIESTAGRERHSSSGVIVCTGTGATGWAASVGRERANPTNAPAPCASVLAFYVREAWPSGATGTAVTSGQIAADEQLQLVSEMNDGGVIFGDGIEDDRLSFHWGVRTTIGVAHTQLQLVTAVA